MKLATRLTITAGLATSLLLGSVAGPALTAEGEAPPAISAQVQTEEADPVTQLAAKALAANPLAPQTASANNGLAPGTYYKWGWTCYYKQVGGVPGNYLWAEYRADIWWGSVNMGCKPTGYKKWSPTKPTSPWYDHAGRRIR